MTNDVNQSRSPILYIRQGWCSVIASFNLIIKACAHVTTIWPQTVTVHCSPRLPLQQQQLHFFPRLTAIIRKKCRRHYTITKLRCCIKQNKILRHDCSLSNSKYTGGSTKNRNQTHRKHDHTFPHIQVYIFIYIHIYNLPHIRGVENDPLQLPDMLYTRWIDH